MAADEKVVQAPEEVKAPVPAVKVELRTLDNWANLLARATVDVMGGLPDRALTAIRAVIYSIENAESKIGEE